MAEIYHARPLKQSSFTSTGSKLYHYPTFTKFDTALASGEPTRVLPLLPTFSGGGAAWLVLGLKIVAAMGFVTTANLVILYAS